MKNNMNVREKLEAGFEKIAVVINNEDKHWYSSPAANTIGRVGALLPAAVLGTLKGVTDSPDIDMVKAIADRYANKNEKNLSVRAEKLKKLDNKPFLTKIKNFILGADHVGPGELSVNVGGSKPFHDISRVWGRPDLSILSKLQGIPTTLGSALIGAGLRADNYNPFSHSVNLYTNESGIMSHEFGHADDYSKQKYPLLHSLKRIIPFLAVPQEITASRYAGNNLKSILQKKLKDKDKVRDALSRQDRLLSAGTGSYLSSNLLGLTGVPNIPGLKMLAGLPGGIIGNLASMGAGGDLYMPEDK